MNGASKQGFDRECRTHMFVEMFKPIIFEFQIGWDDVDIFHWSE